MPSAIRTSDSLLADLKGVVVKIRISLGFGDLFTKCNAHVIQLVTESLESSSSMYKASSAWVAIA